MSTIETYFLIMLGIQVFHSIEELTQNFHEKFPLLKMSFKFFLLFEILFLLFWITIFMLKDIPNRFTLIAFFILLMFINGLWHIVWWGIKKKYVPGLITAPLFVIVFWSFYFYIIAK